MRHYINEIKRMQELAGMHPLNEGPSDISNVESALVSNFEALSKALKARRADREDMDAHDAVEAALVKIAKDAGVRNAEEIPWMEDEMFSGAYSPKEAIKYFKENLIDTLEDQNEETVYDAGSPLDGQRTERPIGETGSGTMYPRIEFEKAVLAAHYEGKLTKEELHIIIDQAI